MNTDYLILSQLKSNPKRTERRKTHPMHYAGTEIESRLEEKITPRVTDEVIIGSEITYTSLLRHLSAHMKSARFFGVFFKLTMCSLSSITSHVIKLEAQNLVGGIYKRICTKFNITNIV